MKLEEAFKLYSDDQILIRAKWKGDGYIPEYMNIGWLKLKVAASSKFYRDAGIFILPVWLEDDEAEDWELLEK